MAEGTTTATTAEQPPATVRVMRLYEALAKAQGAVQPVRKEGVNLESPDMYAFARDADMIAAAKRALTDNGLALIPLEMQAERSELRTRWLLVHRDGGSVELRRTWPVVSTGKTFDKAVATADTASLSYMLRDLLQIERQEVGMDDATKTSAEIIDGLRQELEELRAKMKAAPRAARAETKTSDTKAPPEAKPAGDDTKSPPAGVDQAELAEAQKSVAAQLDRLGVPGENARRSLVKSAAAAVAGVEKTKLTVGDIHAAAAALKDTADKLDDVFARLGIVNAADRGKMLRHASGMKSEPTLADMQRATKNLTDLADVQERTSQKDNDNDDAERRAAAAMRDPPSTPDDGPAPPAPAQTTIVPDPEFDPSLDGDR